MGELFPPRAAVLRGGLRELFAGEKALSQTVDCGQWGLGCNAVHYADLCAFITGKNDFDIDERSGLDDALLASKRPGFVEFTGRMHGTCGSGHRFQLITRAGSDESATISIEGRNRALTIDELGKRATLLSRDEREPASLCPFELPLQSELTHKLVEEILEGGCSLLPTLEQSYAIHAPLLRVFTSHLERVTGTHYAHWPDHVGVLRSIRPWACCGGLSYSRRLHHPRHFIGANPFWSLGGKIKARRPCSPFA